MTSPANEYRFVSVWAIEGTVNEVADILGDAMALPRWWPQVYLKVIELRPGESRLVELTAD